MIRNLHSPKALPASRLRFHLRRVIQIMHNATVVFGTVGVLFVMGCQAILSDSYNHYDTQHSDNETDDSARVSSDSDSNSETDTQTDTGTDTEEPMAYQSFRYADLAGVSGQSDMATGLVQDSSGRLLISGYSYNGTDEDCVVLRLNTDYSIDVTFGTHGGTMLFHNDGDDMCYGIGMNATGMIYVVGNTGGEGRLGQPNVDLMVLGLTNNGKIESSFGVGGKVVMDDVGGFDNVANRTDIGYAMALNTNGDIYVAGQTEGAANTDPFLLKMDRDGDLDVSYGIQPDIDTDDGVDVEGVWQQADHGISADKTADDGVRAMLLSEDGSVLLAGHTDDGDNELTLQRISPDGTLDTDFNYLVNHNPYFENMSGGEDGDDMVAVGAMAKDSAGNIYMCGFGTTNADGRRDGMVMKTDAEGRLITNFGGNNTGAFVFGSDGNDDFCEDVVWDEARGRLYVIGAMTDEDGNSNVTVHFLKSSGTPFGSLFDDGVLVIDSGLGQSKYDSGKEAILSADGKLIVTGVSHSANGDNDLMVWEIDPDFGS